MTWMPVKGYESRYEVNESGVIRTCSGRTLKQSLTDQGYSVVRLSSPRSMVRVHRIVAQAFVSNPLSLPFVNHIDCVRNNNSASNLEWCTQRENLAHSQKLGRMQRDYWVGRRSPRALLDDSTTEEIRDRYSRGGISWAALAREYGVSKRSIGKIILGESYV